MEKALLKPDIQLCKVFRNKDLIESNISSTSFESLTIAFSPDYPHKTACTIFKMTTLVSSLPSKESKTIGAFATVTLNYKNSTIKTLIWLVGERCKLLLNKGMGHKITLTVYISLSQVSFWPWVKEVIVIGFTNRQLHMHPNVCS